MMQSSPLRVLEILPSVSSEGPSCQVLGGLVPWGVATFASGCLCQSPLEHGGDGSNRHWQP